MKPRIAAKTEAEKATRILCTSGLSCSSRQRGSYGVGVRVSISLNDRVAQNKEPTLQ